MDQIDQLIVNRMTEDARVSFRRLAAELKVSPDTIVNRYQKMRQEGLIRGSTVVVNPKKIGYEGMAVFMINVSPAHILADESSPTNSSRILETVIRMRNIILATKTVGDHDLLAVGVVRNFKNLIATGDDIARIPGVKDLEVSFWVEESEICSKYFII